MATLTEMIQGAITPDAVLRASSLIGENSGGTEKALGAVFPTLLSGLNNKFTTGAGPSQLLSMVNDASATNPAGLTDLASAFSKPQSDALMTQGQSLLSGIFGDKTNAVSAALGSNAGISSGSAGKLLAIGAPLVLGMLGRLKSEHNLDANGLANLLTGQQDAINKLVPAGVNDALRSTATVTDKPIITPPVRAAAVTTARPVATAVVPEGRPAWLWPAILGALALAALLFWAFRPHAAPGIALCDGKSLDVLENSFNYNLAKFLSDKSDTSVPKNFVFDHLNFDTDSATITPESKETIDNLATILNACPTAKVRLDGHTDNTGNADANVKLSLARAASVKTALVADGVGADRISTQGFGQTRPIGDNATEEGKAKNRRTELTVLSK